MNTKKIKISMLVFALIVATMLSFSGQAKQDNMQTKEGGMRLDGNLSRLVIHAPSQVMEGAAFLVRVTDENQSLVPNVMITFWNHNYSAPNGTLILIAPVVNQTLVTTIQARAWEYLPTMVNITIINRNETLLGDVNNDGRVNFGDINPFVCAISTNETTFKIFYPHGNYWAADCNQDGVVNFGDINPFIAILSGN